VPKKPRTKRSLFFQKRRGADRLAPPSRLLKRRAAPLDIGQLWLPLPKTRFHTIAFRATPPENHFAGG
jgi:hypothetical protein